MVLRGIQVVVPNMMFSCDGRIIGFMINLAYHDSEKDKKGKGKSDDNQDNFDSEKCFLSIQVWQPLNFSSSGSYTRTGLYELSANDVNSDGKLANVSLPVNKRMRFQLSDIIGYHVPANSSCRILGVQTEENTSFFINTNTSLESFIINDSVTGLKMQPMIQVIFGNGISYSN